MSADENPVADVRPVLGLYANQWGSFRVATVSEAEAALHVALAADPHRQAVCPTCRRPGLTDREATSLSSESENAFRAVALHNAFLDATGRMAEYEAWVDTRDACAHSSPRCAPWCGVEQTELAQEEAALLAAARQIEEAETEGHAHERVTGGFCWTCVEHGKLLADTKAARERRKPSHCNRCGDRDHTTDEHGR